MHLFRELRRAGRGVLDLIRVFGEAGVVVEHRGIGVAHDGEVLFLPMRRDHQNGFRRCAKKLRDLLQCRLEIPVGISHLSFHPGPWPATMRDVEGGKCGSRHWKSVEEIDSKCSPTDAGWVTPAFLVTMIGNCG